MNGLLSREEAMSLCPDYVKFSEGDFELFDKIDENFIKLKKGQSVVTYHNGSFYMAKVTSVDNKSYQAVDGPVIRVSNGEFSWRVDGSGYAYPV